MEFTDDQLIRETLDGCNESFDLLVQKYQGKLRKYVFSITKSESEAEDVLQEAFILAYTHLAKFRGDSKFCTWMYSIARNVAISKIRKSRPHVPLENGLDVAGSVPPPDDNIRVTELSEMVNDALEEMDKDFREIIVYREIEGKTEKEISEILDIPIGTVKSRLHRARSALKLKLGEKL